LEFGNVVFLRRGKTGVPREKPLGAKKRTNNKLNPHNMTSGPEIEPGTHWWEVSALTTAPPLRHPCSPILICEDTLYIWHPYKLTTEYIRKRVSQQAGGAIFS